MEEPLHTERDSGGYSSTSIEREVSIMASL
jgi:hypothetical protein